MPPRPSLISKAKASSDPVDECSSWKVAPGCDGMTACCMVVAKDAVSPYQVISRVGRGCPGLGCIERGCARPCDWCRQTRRFDRKTEDRHSGTPGGKRLIAHGELGKLHPEAGGTDQGILVRRQLP